MTRIHPAELDDLLGDETPFLLDIRPQEHYRDRHIDGSRNVPVYGDLRGGNEDALREHLDEIPDDRAVVTICKQGVVAKRATRVLDEAGYDAATLMGGMSGWTGYQKNSLGYRLRSLLWRLR
ncbi:rhodanese-like domain-containing protein [Halorientalis salina]|uniref:rhodanese-like domain-containing protein n=1 Tax=Halorientalis salina TaxID=2932266 RepID=UPI0010AC9DFD|nr:rhodanese-like domain-containing protein [Halorientalis salina]